MELTQKDPISFSQAWSNLFVGDKIDVDKGMSHMDSDVTVFLSGNPYRLTREADSEEIKHTHQTLEERLEYFQVLDPKVQLFGEIAIVTYYARYKCGKEGSSTLKFNKETLVLKKEETRWKIVHMHNSL